MMDYKSFSFVKMFFVLGLAFVLSAAVPVFFKKEYHRLQAMQEGHSDQISIGLGFKEVMASGTGSAGSSGSGCTSKTLRYLVGVGVFLIAIGILVFALRKRHQNQVAS